MLVIKYFWDLRSVDLVQAFPQRMGVTDQFFFVLRLKSLYCLILLDVRWNVPWETKVTNFHGAVLVNQEVRRFDVSMYNVGRVHVVDRAQRIVHYGYDVVFRNIGAFAHSGYYFLEVWLMVLQNQEQITHRFDTVLNEVQIFFSVKHSASGHTSFGWKTNVFPFNTCWGISRWCHIISVEGTGSIINHLCHGLMFFWYIP